MAKRIAFQFDDKLEYQLQAVQAAVELFRGIYREGEKGSRENRPIPDENRLLSNLQRVQNENGLFPDRSLNGGRNFTVEMETGTGKTYVYLRTILELNRTYGFTKFIIVVPSIAIRKGVEQSLHQLGGHFRALYGVDMEKHSFVYDSNNLRRVGSQFVETRDLSLCIMNIQAFNKDSNKIRTADEYGRILWREIQSIHPIIIMDEPQKIEGTGAKRSRSMEAIEQLLPLFTLRYSATHRYLYHPIFRLDSYGAYQQHLVKGIRVKTVCGAVPKDYPYIRYLAFTSDWKARIQLFYQEKGEPIRFKTASVRGGASLEELSGGLPAYKNMRIGADPHGKKNLEIVTEKGSYFLPMGESNYIQNSKEIVRIQIRLAIQSHLEKQLAILKAGRQIKVLTLFFVDSVAKVRDHSRADGRGEYLRIFDEEYGNALSRYAEELDPYRELFPRLRDLQEVREGYFAVDKKYREVEIAGWDPGREDHKVRAKAQEDIDRGISLILEKKDQLISFDEPLAFIFSHSALREGWDNPNVFTLCTLKSAGSEIAKKQEIGRGLRLPVDMDGNRCTDTAINELTVIANDSYEHFARTLQQDFNADMNFSQKEVTASILQQALKKAGIPPELRTAKLAASLRDVMEERGILTQHNVLREEELENVSVLPSSLSQWEAAFHEAFLRLMEEKRDRTIAVKNGDEPSPENGLAPGMEGEKLQYLRGHLGSILAVRTLYRVCLDPQTFTAACVKELNSRLPQTAVHAGYRVETGKGVYGRLHGFTLEAEIPEYVPGTDTAPEAKSDLQLINTVMYHTGLPRLAIGKILAGISQRELLDRPEILEEAIRIIMDVFSAEKASHVASYEAVGCSGDDPERFFHPDTIGAEEFAVPHRVFTANGGGAVNRYYRMDSREEYEFARCLERDGQVLLFTKLPRESVSIPTPCGPLFPNWAMVCAKNGIYSKREDLSCFVTQFRREHTWEEIPEKDRNKIACARLHFQAAAAGTAFDWVFGYEDFLKKLVWI